MLSISLDESLPTELEMVMLALRPEVFSVAVTLRIPLTSTSKTTSRTASPAKTLSANANSTTTMAQFTLHGWDWGQGKLPERSIVFTVDSLIVGLVCSIS